MSGHRMARITEDIKREIATSLHELKDPRINKSLLSVVKVEVTNDLSYARIYVSSLDGFNSAKQAVKGLKSASGFMRHKLGKNIKIRNVPELIFYATDSIEYGTNISEILNKI